MRGILLRLLLCQMALDNIRTATINFFFYAYPLLNDPKGVGCRKMAAAASTTRQQARLHILKLQETGYVERLNYHTWRIVDNPPIRDEDLKELWRLARWNRQIPEGNQRMNHHALEAARSMRP